MGRFWPPPNRVGRGHDVPNHRPSVAVRSTRAENRRPRFPSVLGTLAAQWRRSAGPPGPGERRKADAGPCHRCGGGARNRRGSTRRPKTSPVHDPVGHDYCGPRYGAHDLRPITGGPRMLEGAAAEAASAGAAIVPVEFGRCVGAGRAPKPRGPPARSNPPGHGGPKPRGRTGRHCRRRDLAVEPGRGELPVGPVHAPSATDRILSSSLG